MFPRFLCCAPSSHWWLRIHHDALYLEPTLLASDWVFLGFSVLPYESQLHPGKGSCLVRDQEKVLGSHLMLHPRIISWTVKNTHRSQLYIPDPGFSPSSIIQAPDRVSCLQLGGGCPAPLGCLITACDSRSRDPTDTFFLDMHTMHIHACRQNILHTHKRSKSKIKNLKQLKEGFVLAHSLVLQSTMAGEMWAQGA